MKDVWAQLLQSCSVCKVSRRRQELIVDGCCCGAVAVAVLMLRCGCAAVAAESDPPHTSLSPRSQGPRAHGHIQCNENRRTPYVLLMVVTCSLSDIMHLQREGANTPCVDASDRPQHRPQHQRSHSNSNHQRSVPASSC